MEEQYKQHGVFSWCELMTSDVGAAKDFYTKLFGWKTKDMSMEGMTYTMFKAGDKDVGGIMMVPKEAKVCLQNGVLKLLSIMLMK